MITPKTFAILAAEAYETDGGKVPEGWEVFRHSYDEPNSQGLGVACYYNKTQNRAIFAFRGTNFTDIDNLKTDFSLAFGQIPGNFQIALDFIESTIADLPKAIKIYCTGHSLGAIYAELIAYIYQCLAVTFESPGTKPLISKLPFIKPDNRAIIINFLAAPNVVNTLHPKAAKDKHVFRAYIGHQEPGVDGWYAARCVLGTITRAGAWGAAAAGAGGLTIPALVGAATAGASQTFSYVVLKACDYVLWLKRQHAMLNMITEFSSEDGFAKKLGIVEQWPSLKVFIPTIDGLKTDMVKTLTPFHKDNPGLHNLFSENELLENSIKQLPDYQVKTSTGEEALHAQTSLFDALFTAEEFFPFEAKTLLRTPEQVQTLNQALTEFTQQTTNCLNQALVTQPSENEERALMLRQITTTSLIPTPSNSTTTTTSASSNEASPPTSSTSAITTTSTTSSSSATALAQNSKIYTKPIAKSPEKKRDRAAMAGSGETATTVEGEPPAKQVRTTPQ